MNHLDPQQFQAHAKVHGVRLTNEIAAERARRNQRGTTEPSTAIRLTAARPGRVRAVAFGALAFLAGGLVSRTGAVEAQTTPPPPPAATAMLPAPECVVTVADAAPMVTRTLPRRDRLAQIPV